MEWYKFIFVAIVWVVGLYLRGKIYEEKNGYKRNERKNSKKYRY